MRGIPITKRRVDALKAADREYFAWDSDLKGFGLRVRPTGEKSYVAKYRAGTTQRYAHLDTDPLRRASEHIGGHLAAAMGEPVKKQVAGKHRFTALRLAVAPPRRKSGS